MAQISFTLNGAAKTVTVDSIETPLLWVLRDVIGLTGTKYGCGVEICGACTVMVNGQPEKSCDKKIGEVALYFGRDCAPAAAPAPEENEERLR